MALTTAERTNIIKLVVAMFNAAPGATYLGELTVAYEANGRSLSNLAKDLSQTTAYKALNPVFQTASEFATALLTPLGLQANTTAIDFVTAKFNAGVSKGQIAFDVAVALAATTATEFADAKAILNNKTAVAEYYSVTKAISQTNVATLQQSISTVTKDAASVTAANSAIDGSGVANAGNTFTLTTGIDVLNGTTGNDTFIGSAAPATLNGADQINGGGGTDILKIYGTNTIPAITSIETLYFNVPGAAVNVVGSTEVTLLQIEGDAAGYTHKINGNQNVDIIGNTAAITTTIDISTATDAQLSLGLNKAGVGGALTVDITGSTALATLDISSKTAASTITLTTSGTAGMVKTINVTGEVAANITATGLTGVTTVDASKMTAGGLTFAAGNSNVKFTGSAANDTATFAATQFTALDVVDGGAGTDTIKLSDTAFTDATSNQLKGLNASKNVETLAFGAAAVTLDASLITSGINSFRADTGGDTYAFSNLNNTSSVEANAITTGAKDFTLANKLGDLTGNLKVTATAAANASVTQLVLTGIGTLNLESAFTGAGSQATANVVTVKTNADNTVFNLKGAQALTFSGVQATTTGSTIDGSTATGKLTVTGSGKADIVKGGTAGDVLNVTAGGDVLTGGAGADTFLYAGGDAVLGGTANVSTITDFTAGSDKISFKGGADAFLTGLNLTAVAVTLNTAQTIATAADLAAVYAGITAIGASTNTAQQAVLVTVSAGGAAGTYLYVNDEAGAVAAANDLLIKLTGTVGTITAADFSFTA